jgi:hAT family C-terminal dimerisation region
MVGATATQIIASIGRCLACWPHISAVLASLGIHDNIPVISAENERLFSSFKDLISDSRNTLDIESTKVIKYIRNWSTTP